MHSCILCNIGVSDENKPESTAVYAGGFDITPSDRSSRLPCKFQWKAAITVLLESDGGNN